MSELVRPDCDSYVLEQLGFFTADGSKGDEAGDPFIEYTLHAVNKSQRVKILFKVKGKTLVGFE